VDSQGRLDTAQLKSSFTAVETRQHKGPDAALRATDSNDGRANANAKAAARETKMLEDLALIRKLEKESGVYTKVHDPLWAKSDTTSDYEFGDTDSERGHDRLEE